MVLIVDLAGDWWIGDFFKELRLSERKGTGFPKIGKALKENEIRSDMNFKYP